MPLFCKWSTPLDIYFCDNDASSCYRSMHWLLIPPTLPSYPAAALLTPTDPYLSGHTPSGPAVATGQREQWTPLHQWHQPLVSCVHSFNPAFCKSLMCVSFVTLMQHFLTHLFMFFCLCKDVVCLRVGGCLCHPALTCIYQRLWQQQKRKANRKARSVFVGTFQTQSESWSQTEQ